jgi:hypothetical protein
MSRNGSGTYSLPAGNPVVTGTTIASTWANNTLSDIASALTDSVAADGQTSMSGNLNLNSNKIVNLATPTLSTDAVTKAYVDTADALSLLKASNLSDVANATTSRTNLVAAKSGANSDITSLTGLTTPLTVAQGGIGAATLTANNVLLGNGTSALQVVAPSTSGNVLTSNGTTWTSVAGAYPLTSGTAVASTSGTSIDFTSIPSWVKRITVMFDGVSTNGTSPILIQVGDSGGIETSGYVSRADRDGASTASTAGFILNDSSSAASTYQGAIVLNNLNAATFTWVANGNLNSTSQNNVMSSAGAKSLSATLDRVRVTTANGTDIFDAGTINILYE